MAWTPLLVCFRFYIPNSCSTHADLVALFVFLFAAFYSPSEGPASFAYFAEVFPLSRREVRVTFPVAMNLFWAAVPFL